MWGIIPAAGMGTRIQPLGFSKELLPVGGRAEESRRRPKAVSEYLIERMLLGGVTRFCFVISREKTDILRYYGGSVDGADVCYVVQPEPRGLCDALFRATPLVGLEEAVMVGLPDTIWFPEDALRALPDAPLSFLLFPVERPELFDAVLTGEESQVTRVEVKQAHPGTHWIWGAFRMRGRTFHEMRQLWLSEPARSEYWGTLVNCYLEAGGEAIAVRAGRSYVDVGTLLGFEEAIRTVALPTGERSAPNALK